MASEEELRKKARRQAKEKVDFFMHFGVYLAVNAFLIAIWWASGGGFPWFIFPLFGWGIGIVAHFIGAYTDNSIFLERMTEKELQKLKEKK